MEIDKQQFGEMRAEIKGLTRAFSDVSDQVKKNSEGVGNLRVEYQEVLTNLANVLSARNEDKAEARDHRADFKEFVKVLNEIKENQIDPKEYDALRTKVNISLGVVAFAWAVILAIPKIAPNASPFLTQIQVKNIVEDVVEEQVPIIVADQLNKK